MRSQVDAEPLDSAFLVGLEQMIAQQEMRNAIGEYEDEMLRQEMRFEWTDLIPVVKGGISVFTRHDFVYNHHAVFKNTNSKWKDYAVAGAPLVAAWIMKAAGVKSRSTTRRMLTSNAFAFAIAGGLTEGTKFIVKEQRPDLSDNHSFPSGHTVLAYMGATVISREFDHVSPWITVGAYGAATATELLRIKHNSHWLNDIYMGAGIGVVSTNVGYWLADRIYGKEGINKPEMSGRDLVRAMKMINRPSSIALVASTDMGKTKISSENLSFSKGMDEFEEKDINVHISSFSLAGVEASWYLTPNIAVEAIAQSALAQGKIYTSSNTIFTGNTLQMYRGSLAMKGSVALAGTPTRVGARVMGGVRNIQRADFFRTESDAYNPNEYYRVSIPKETKFELGCGLGYDVLATKSHIVGFNVDYYHAFSKITPNRFQLGTVWKILF